MADKPSAPSSVAASSWPTILKITLDLSKRSFSPSFRYSPLEPMKHNVLCSCAQITAFKVNKTKQAIQFEFPLDSNKPRFVFYDPARVESARQLCEAAAKHNTTPQFLLAVQELLSNLAKICEGKPTPGMRTKLGDTNFQPFRTDFLDNKSVCEELRTKICTPLHPSEVLNHGLGYIYILRAQSYDTLAQLKVGFSKHHPEHRAHQLAGCLRSPEVVAHSPMIPHANRIESIIHAELVSLRKTQFCAQCQRQHKEWFTISHIHVRQVVTRWCRWVLTQPCRNGVLTSQWQDHLNKQDFSQRPASDRLSKIWTEIIDTYQMDESIESADKQRASYINEIFLEKNIQACCDQIGLSRKGDFDDMIRIARTTRILSGGVGLSAANVKLPGYLGFSHLFDDVIEFPPSRYEGDDHYNLEYRHAKHQKHVQEVEELVQTILSIKTGCLSVSSLDLGVSESPMGDATILPVVTLREMEHLEGQAKLGIGYNPAHIGFQFIQEAYQRGEWVGPLPRFKRPKITSIFDSNEPLCTPQQTNISSQGRKVFRKSHDADAPSSYRMKEHELGSANSQEPRVPDMSLREESNPQKRKIPSKGSEDPDNEMASEEPTAGSTKVEYKYGEDGEKSTITFSAPLTDDLIDQVNKMVEDLRNGGRENLERKFNETLRYYGVETMVASDDDSATEDGESSSEGDLAPFDPPSPQDIPSRNASNISKGFSKNVVAAWFNSPKFN